MAEAPDHAGPGSAGLCIRWLAMALALAFVAVACSATPISLPMQDGGVHDPPDAGAKYSDANSSGGHDALVPEAGWPDAGVPEAGRPEAGVPEAGVPEAGWPESGPPDLAVPEAGWPDTTRRDAKAASDSTRADGPLASTPDA